MRVAILIPVYNDWACLPRLLAEIDATLGDDCKASVVIINDGGASLPRDIPLLETCNRIGDVRIVELVRNVGNQIAGSIGLSLARDEVPCDCVVVMDGDGQDRPAHIKDLIDEHRQNPGALITAERSGRAEGHVFRAGYKVFRFIFQALTSRRIISGNFSLIPRQHLARLCAMPELPFHFSAGLIKSRLPIRYVPCFRDPRYDGVSSQSFVSLVMHGINALSVFSETVLIRISLGAAVLIALSLVAILMITAIRLLTSIWIMGFATTVIGLLTLVMGQAILLCLIGIFVRAQRPQSTIADPQQYRAAIANIHNLTEQKPLRVAR